MPDPICIVFITGNLTIFINLKNKTVIMEIDTSSKSVMIGAAAAVIGILVLILAFLMSWGDVVMILGVVLAVVGVVIFYLKPLDGAMGAAKPKAAPKAAPAKVAGRSAKTPAKNYGDSPLGKALTFAEQKLNDKEDKLPSSVVEFYRGKIAAYAQMVGKDEESALIGMSQVIGAIVSA